MPNKTITKAGDIGMSIKTQLVFQRWGVYLAILGVIVCSSTLATAANLPDVMDAAERMDRMTAVGILSACLIAESLILGYMIHLVFTKFMSTMAAANATMARVADAIGKCEKKGE